MLVKMRLSCVLSAAISCNHSLWTQQQRSPRMTSTRTRSRIHSAVEIIFANIRFWQYLLSYSMRNSFQGTALNSCRFSEEEHASMSAFFLCFLGFARFFIQQRLNLPLVITLNSSTLAPSCSCSLMQRSQVLINCRNNHKLIARVKAFDRHCNMYVV